MAKIDYCEKYGGYGNSKVDKKMKLDLQERLQELFTEDEITLEEVKEALDIKDNDIYTIYKSLYMTGNKVSKEDLIRVLMGGKLIIGQA